MASKNKKYFWPGVIFTCIGITLFVWVMIHDLSQAPLGPYFSICMGLFFSYIGVMRIKKSRQPDDYQAEVLDNEKFIINQPASFKFTEKKTEIPEKLKPEEAGIPLLIKCVAFSPALPLAAGLIGAAACGLMGYRESCVFGSGQEGLVYLGVLGWLVSLPVAGLLKVMYSSSKL